MHWCLLCHESVSLADICRFMCPSGLVHGNGECFDANQHQETWAGVAAGRERALQTSLIITTTCMLAQGRPLSTTCSMLHSAILYLRITLLDPSRFDLYCHSTVLNIRTRKTALIQLSIGRSCISS